MLHTIDTLNRHRRLNAITNKIDSDDWSRWLKHSSVVCFEVLRRERSPGVLSTHAIFPTTAIFSLSSESSNGGAAESNLAGNEGLVGLCRLTNSQGLAMRASLQTPGFGISIPFTFLLREIESSRNFRRSVLDYASATVRYATQTCFCYRFHSIEQQVIKMILLTLRRTGGNCVEMTHDRIATILGVRREAVSSTLGRLSKTKLITQSKCRVAVTSVSALEAQACDCYGAICRILGYFKP